MLLDRLSLSMSRRLWLAESESAARSVSRELGVSPRTIKQECQSPEGGGGMCVLGKF